MCRYLEFSCFAHFKSVSDVELFPLDHIVMSYHGKLINCGSLTDQVMPVLRTADVAV